jgi:hypothetical protein
MCILSRQGASWVRKGWSYLAVFVTSEKHRSSHNSRRTYLDFENVGSIIRLNEYDLILVVKIQRPRLVYLDREMKHCDSHFHNGVQSGAATVRLSYEFCASEAKLWSPSAWHKDGAVVNRDRDWLFDWTGIFIPEGCGRDRVAQQRRILVKPSKGSNYWKLTKRDIRVMYFLCCPWLPFIGCQI